MADINLGVGGANSAVAGGYDIDNSVKLDKGNDTTTVEFFERTVSSSGNRDVGTFSAWIKKTDVSTAQYLFTFGNTDNDNGRTFARFQTDGTLRIGGGTSVWRNTDRKFRDTSAWYHIVIAFDTTQSTANDRIKLYINGVQETSFSTTNNPSQNDDLGLAFEKQAIGYNTIDNNSGFNGYMSEVVIQDGVASAPTEFGEFDSNTGIWIPKDASDATMGTNGSYLKFENAASMGAASAGNAFTVQNINQNDQSTDTPTNNFCTLNPLYKCADTTMTDGATNCDRTNNGNNTVRGTFVVTTGKWYWEVAVHRGTVNANYPFMGMTGNFTTEPCSWLYGDSKSFYVSGSGSVEDAGSYKGAGTAAAQDPSHSIYGFAVDIDNEELYWYTNGTVNNSGNAYSISTSVGNSDEGMTPFLFMFTGANQSFNFGGYSVITPSSATSDANGYGTFEYAPPSGYYALCTKNLAEFG